MKQLKTGNFFGKTDKTVRMEEIALTSTEYTGQQPVPWHFHENSYFTYVVSGYLEEVNKNKTIACTAGTLLFNFTQDPHYNKNHSQRTRQFYIEINNKWFEHHHIDMRAVYGKKIVNNSILVSLVEKIFKEFKINDLASKISIEGLLLLGFGEITRSLQNEKSVSPVWVVKIKEIINERFDQRLTLQILSEETGIHPIYISHNFKKYFHCSLSTFLRKVRIEKSIAMLGDKTLSVADIAYDTGFSDPSHYIRCFREINKITPSQYRAIIFRS